MTIFIKESDAKRGRLASYISDLGGVGLCYLVDGRAWKSGGNGFYYLLPEDHQVIRDGGSTYRAKLEHLARPLV